MTAAFDWKLARWLSSSGVFSCPSLLKFQSTKSAVWTSSPSKQRTIAAKKTWSNLVGCSFHNMKSTWCWTDSDLSEIIFQGQPDPRLCGNKLLLSSARLGCTSKAAFTVRVIMICLKIAAGIKCFGRVLIYRCECLVHEPYKTNESVRGFPWKSSFLNTFETYFKEKYLAENYDVCVSF